MYFDVAVNQFRGGVGIILLTPEGEVVPIRVMNNEAEYEAHALGMEALIAIGVTEVEIFGDSMLVINQTTEEYDLKEQYLKPYLSHLQ